MSSGGISKSLRIPDQQGVMVRRTFVARYSDEKDEFSLKVPAYLDGGPGGWSKSGDEDWKPSITENTITGKSPAELFKQVEKAGKAYAESLKKKVKIIGYSIVYNIDRKVDVDCPWEEKKATEATMLEISWEVGWKIDVLGKTTFGRGEDGSEYMHDPDQWIEWTPEREAFFKDTEFALATLALKFSDFFVKNHKRLGLQIDSAPRALLLEGPKKKAEHK